MTASRTYADATASAVVSMTTGIGMVEFKRWWDATSVARTITVTTTTRQIATKRGHAPGEERGQTGPAAVRHGES